MKQHVRIKGSRIILGLIASWALVGCGINNPPQVNPPPPVPRDETTPNSGGSTPAKTPKAESPLQGQNKGSKEAPDAAKTKIDSTDKITPKRDSKDQKATERVSIEDSAKVLLFSPVSTAQFYAVFFATVAGILLAFKWQTTRLSRLSSRLNSMVQIDSDHKSAIASTGADIKRLDASIKILSTKLDSTIHNLYGLAEQAASREVQSSGSTPAPLRPLTQQGQTASVAQHWSDNIPRIHQVQPESPAKDPRESIEAITRDYQTAVQNNDRGALRRISSIELNITIESEEKLARRSLAHNTQLKIVQGGGSYLLVRSDKRSWLFPTMQTLEGFKSNQPQKGIFTFERQPVSTAELKQPAEIKEVGDLWEVANQGVVNIPN